MRNLIIGGQWLFTVLAWAGAWVCAFKFREPASTVFFVGIAVWNLYDLNQDRKR